MTKRGRKKQVDRVQAIKKSVALKSDAVVSDKTEEQEKADIESALWGLAETRHSVLALKILAQMKGFLTEKSEVKHTFDIDADRHAAIRQAAQKRLAEHLALKQPENIIEGQIVDEIKVEELPF